MAQQFDTKVFRTPSVYTREVDVSTITRPATREQIKERLKSDPELLSEIVSELRKEKIQKIKNKK